MKPDKFEPTIVKETPEYLYVTYKSPSFGFVDDVEFYFPPSNSEVCALPDNSITDLPQLLFRSGTQKSSAGGGESFTPRRQLDDKCVISKQVSQAFD